MHWCIRYLGKKWTNEQDCYYWFATIQHEQFNRDVPFVVGTEDEKAKALMGQRKQWVLVALDQAKDGDAVLMKQAGKLSNHHHIGVWCDANGGAVLHAPQDRTVQLDDLPSLQLSGWELREVLTHG